MSSCNTDLVCGTGGWTGPKPGDPDNVSVLTATPAFGGIDVQWTLPTTNAHAVAHVHIYRGTSDNFSHASRLVSVSGNFHHDRITSSTSIRYFYWIEIVSINGTVGKPIGPASATARPLIEDLIEQLTGQIDAGVLAQSLKGEIARIQGLQDGITKQETFIKNEVQALGNVVQAIQATVDETSAVVLQETHVRASSDQSLAKQASTIQSSLGRDIASVSTEASTNIKKVGDKVAEIGALWTAKVDVNGLIGGFGVYNDGKTVEAGFDVDRFWVGRTTNKRKPFIIENGEVFINEAVINKLTFSKLRDERGSFIVENGKLKADYVQSKMITADWIDSRNLTIKDAQGQVIFSATQKLGGAYIAKGSIGETHIGTASINTAHIKNLAVDTFKIAENSVTLHSSYQTSNATGGSFNVVVPHRAEIIVLMYLPTSGSFTDSATPWWNTSWEEDSISSTTVTGKAGTVTIPLVGITVTRTIYRERGGDSGGVSTSSGGSITTACVGFAKLSVAAHSTTVISCPKAFHAVALITYK